LHANRLDILFPYTKDVATLGRRYFESVGIEVASSGFMNQFRGMEDIRPQFIYRQARKLASDHGQAMFISCTNVSALPILQQLAQDIGRPALSSNVALLWAALDMAGVSTSLSELVSMGSARVRSLLA
jgi:maleate isomerase